MSAGDTATHGMTSRLEELARAHEQARRDAEDVATANLALLDAETVAAANQARDVAADLRTRLQVGDCCPVCEQTVLTVPAPLGVTEVTTAQEALTATRAAATRAERAASRSETALAAAVAAATSARANVQQTRAAAAAMLTDLAVINDAALPDALDLADIPAVTVTTDPATLTAATRVALDGFDALMIALTAATERVTVLQRQRADADRDIDIAATAIRTAEQAAQAARSRQATLADRARAARTVLRTTRDPLVALGAPDLDDTDLPAAWSALTSWADAAANARRHAVTDAQARADQATAAHRQARDAAQSAQQVFQAARTAYEAALRDHEQAVAIEQSLIERLAELDETLAAAPPLKKVTADLATLATLEATAEAERVRLADARVARDNAERDMRSLDQRHRDARTQLAAARDPLVALGAPALPDTLSLAEAWTRLAAWATAASAERTGARATLAAEREQRAHVLAEVEQVLRARLAAVGVDSSDPRPVALWAPAAAARTCASAAAAVHTIQAAQARCATLQTEIRNAVAQAQVANDLAKLLAINGFPRWLSKSALEVLVTAASTTLVELSGGQFELDLADNDSVSFTVIDHTDADAVRPVKTLSGGETFQASLSLALALSTHLGALASKGAAQLEAIFIDEGFGTLDENTLDTVATTLETLATSAGRMVGVVTHVPALAARIPVRFAVQRDPRGSSIQRVTA